MAVLICGGAGYIGSHNVRAFTEHGEEVIVVDSLETGHRASVPENIKFYEGDIRNAEVLDRIFTENKVEAVIHFCAYSLVGESMEKPLKYFDNNVGGMISLLEAMYRHGVKSPQRQPLTANPRESRFSRPTRRYPPTPTVRASVSWRR